MTAALPHHPLASLFPLLDGDEFDVLVADIRAHGLRQRIVLHDGKILDGRNRYAACLEAGIVEQFRSPMPKFTGDFEWYTPVEYIELAVEVMGAIDCDPASCANANKVVGAKVFYSQDDDGLKQEWHGRVWLNPPYATDLIRPFTSLLLEKYARGEVTEAIALTNNVTETLAIQTLMRSCRAICFPEGRIKFYKTTDQERANGAGHGQALFYFGRNAKKFRHVFGRKGEIVLPWREDIIFDLIGLGTAGGSI